VGEGPGRVRGGNLFRPRRLGESGPPPIFDGSAIPRRAIRVASRRARPSGWRARRRRPRRRTSTERSVVATHATGDVAFPAWRARPQPARGSAPHGDRPARGRTRELITGDDFPVVRPLRRHRGNERLPLARRGQAQAVRVARVTATGSCPRHGRRSLWRVRQEVHAWRSRRGTSTPATPRLRGPPFWSRIP